MEIKLNVYDKSNKVVKTYTANEVNLSFGVVEDVLALINVDTITNTKDDVTLMKEVLKVVVGGFGTVKTILKEIWPEITEDELRSTNIKEVANAIIAAVKFAFAEIELFPKPKN